MEYFDKLHLADIIARKMAGHISEEEEALLAVWLAGSEANRDLYDRIKSGKSYKWHSENFSGLDTERMVADVKRRIRSRRRKISAVSASAAAVLVIGLVTAVFLREQRNDISELFSHRAHAVMTFEGGAAITRVELADKDNESAWREQLAQNPVPQSVEYEPVKITIAVPRGAEYKVRLNDGTLVWLNAGSSLEYPEVFANGERRVRLDGEAYFEVAHDSDKPFIVNVSSDMSVKVLGTEFNVNTHAADHINTVLVNGSVEIYSGITGMRHIMSPSQIAHFDKTTGETTVSDTDVAPYVSWKDGVFYFRNESMDNIMQELGRWYGMDVVFADDSIRHLHFTGTVKRNVKAGIILEAMLHSIQVRYLINDETITLYYE